MSRGWVNCSLGGFTLEARWDIQPGQVMVLFGPSGAGKTTTLRAIAGLVRPLGGHIEIGDRVVYDSARNTWTPPHRRRVGYLTQQFHLFPHLTVANNIAYGLSHLSKSAARDRVHQLTRSLGLEGLEDRRTWQISGGEQQRVALARALATGPELLLLDEPFSSLDAELRRSLRRELRVVLAESAMPVLLVTHDREEALAMGDSVQVIDHGKIISEGEPLDVLGQPGRGRVARLVGVENLLHLTLESRNPRDGTMMCVGEGVRLEVPLDHPPSPADSAADGAAEGADGSHEPVTVGIRASDIILSMGEPVGSSARNRLPGRVTGVEQRPAGYEVTVDCGPLLRCHITGSALAELGIEQGMDIWAVFKASSCFLVQEEAAGSDISEVSP